MPDGVARKQPAAIGWTVLIPDEQDSRWWLFTSIVFLDANAAHACVLFILDLFALAPLEAFCHE